MNKQRLAGRPRLAMESKDKRSHIRMLAIGMALFGQVIVCFRYWLQSLVNSLQIAFSPDEQT
jgi:hypothetical protein